MITQAGIEINGKEVIYWLHHERRDAVFCTPGKLVSFRTADNQDLTGLVTREYGGYEDGVKLPPNVRVGTITSLI